MTRLIRSLLPFLLVAGFFSVLPIETANAAGKVTICHRTRSVTNPYRMITVSQSAATKNAGHKGHTGGVFVTTANYYNTHAKDWGDIMPGSDSDGAPYNGGNFDKNWDAAGKAFFPGGANAALCSKMTAKQFYDIQIAALGAGNEQAVVDDLIEQEANEDAALFAALGGAANLDTTNILTSDTVVSATTTAATETTTSTAKLNGSIKAGSLATKWQFQWGTSSTLATSTTTTISSGSITSATQSVNFVISGLSGNTTYYFRVLGVTNAGSDTEGILYGDILSFTTPAAGSAAQVIDFPSLSNKTYGDADFTIQSRSETPTVSGVATGLIVAYTSQTTSVCSVGSSTLSGSDSSTATLTIVSIGTCTIRASQGGGLSGGTNYGAATNVDRSFTISPAPLSITADNKSKTEGASDPANSASVTGTTFNGDVVTVTGVTYSRASGESVGSYAITPATGTLSSSNYTITSYINGTLTITSVIVSSGGGGGNGNSKSPQKAVPIKNTVIPNVKKYDSAAPNSPGTPNPSPSNAPGTPAASNPSGEASPTPTPTPGKSPEPKQTQKLDPLPEAVVPLKDGENNPIPLQEAEIKKGPVKETVDEAGKLKLIIPIGFKGTVEIEITPKPLNPGGPTEKQIIEVPVEGPKPPVEPEENLITRPRLLPPAAGKVNVLGLVEEVNVSWKPDPKAQAYEIYSNKELVCTTVYSSCSVPAENGVKKEYEVVTITSTGNSTIGKSTGAALARGTLLAIVYFATDKDVLTSKSIATLNKLSVDLRALGLRDVNLTGHTDTQAPSEYNQALSTRRSVRVDKYLKGKVRNAFISKEANGEDLLAVQTADEVNAAKNRRVEIRVW